MQAVARVSVLSLLRSSILRTVINDPVSWLFVRLRRVAAVKTSCDKPITSLRSFGETFSAVGRRAPVPGQWFRRLPCG